MCHRLLIGQAKKITYYGILLDISDIFNAFDIDDIHLFVAAGDRAVPLILFHGRRRAQLRERTSKIIVG